jgi:hypothetical protein
MRNEKKAKKKKNRQADPTQCANNRAGETGGALRNATL